MLPRSFIIWLLSIICALPAAAASIDLQASTVTPAVNASFTVQVKLLAGPLLTTSQVRIAFDNTKLQLLTAVKDSAAISATPSDANVVALANTNNAFYQVNDYPSVASSGTLHTLTFKALSAGATTLTLKAYPADPLGCALYNDAFAEVIPTVAVATTITIGSVTPTNTAPVVNAGVDKTITLPTSVSLTATATDDGLPTPAALTHLWTKQSGPGTVTFSAGTSLTTNASFSVAGVYVLRLTTSDGALPGFDDVTVTVNAAPIPTIVTSLSYVLSGTAPDTATAVKVIASSVTTTATLSPLTGTNRTWTVTILAPVGTTVATVQFLAPDNSVKSRAFNLVR